MEREGKGERGNDHSDSASEVIITVYPVETSVKAGQEVSFECRARTSDGAEYPSVSWSKVGGELSPSAHSVSSLFLLPPFILPFQSSGRLSISSATASDQGRYVCVANHGGQTFEAHASLTVRTGEYPSPSPPSTPFFPFQDPLAMDSMVEDHAWPMRRHAPIMSE